jgi:hypothetical protein
MDKSDTIEQEIELDEVQIDLLYKEFFRPDSEHTKLEGLKLVTRELLKTGRCVVPAKGLLAWWEDRLVSYYLALKEAPGTVGCTMIELDRERFLRGPGLSHSLEWLRDNIGGRLEDIQCELDAIDRMLELAQSLREAAGVGGCDEKPAEPARGEGDE